MIKDVEALARELQIKKCIEVDLGTYKVTRPLFYHEAIDLAKKQTEGLTKYLEAEK